MRDYSKVSPAVWQSSRFNGLPSDDGRYLYLYFLTSQHQNSAGCYVLPDGYAAIDLNWPIERYRAARKLLMDAGIIDFDNTANVVRIMRWFSHNPPMNPSHRKGIHSILQRIPSNTLAGDAWKESEAAWESMQARPVPTQPKTMNGRQ